MSRRKCKKGVLFSLVFLVVRCPYNRRDSCTKPEIFPKHSSKFQGWIKNCPKIELDGNAMRPWNLLDEKEILQQRNPGSDIDSLWIEHTFIRRNVIEQFVIVPNWRYQMDLLCIKWSWNQSGRTFVGNGKKHSSKNNILGVLLCTFQMHFSVRTIVWQRCRHRIDIRCNQP